MTEATRPRPSGPPRGGPNDRGARDTVPGGPGQPEEGGPDDDPGPGTGAAGIALAVALVTALVMVFVLAEWHVAGFRRAMVWLAPRMATGLYVLAAGTLLGSVVRRFLATRSGTKAAPHRFIGIRLLLVRFRFLALPAAMSGSILVFLVPLFSTWANGFRPPIVVAGIIPYSDGTLWFGGGERLLFNGAVDDYSGKRPLNPALAAVRLALTNLDLRLAMVVEVVLLGVACFLVARVVARHLGLPAALALFAGVYGFVGLFTPTTFTETLGVTFGALAVAALWAALHDRSPRLFATGLFLLTVALGVRPGAVAVVLLLPLWFARITPRDEGRLVAWPALRLGVAAVVAGLVVNLAAAFSTGANPATLNSNSMYMVYGLAMGYPGWDVTPKGWGRVLYDHPEILPFDDSARTAAVNRLAVQAVRNHPSRFVAALIRSEANYLRMAKRQTMVVTDLPLRRALQAGALVLGALALYRRRSEGWPSMLVDVGLFCASLLSLPVLLLWGGAAGLPAWLGGALALVSYCAFVLMGSSRVGWAHRGFLLVVAAGVLLTLPIIGLDTARVLAATAPLMAIPMALSVSLLARGRSEGLTVAGESAPRPPAVLLGRSRWSPAVAGVVLVAVALVGAPVAAALVHQPDIAHRACPDGSPAEALLGGVSVRVVADAAAAAGGVDAMDVASATRDVANVNGLEVVTGLIRPGTTIVAGINERGGDRVVFLDGTVRAAGSSVLYFCGGPLNDVTSAILTDAFWPKPVDFAFMIGTPLAP